MRPVPLLTTIMTWMLVILPACSWAQAVDSTSVLDQGTVPYTPQTGIMPPEGGTEQDSTIHTPRGAVVLSGGGAKGMAHIGVLKVLERAGIPVDIITGTSMGSIVGALYAVGWDATRLDTLVRGQDWSFLLSDRDDYYSQNLLNRERQSTYFLSKSYTLDKGKNLSETGGLVRGKNLRTLFTRLTEGYTDSLDFNQLPIPFACVATNIVDYSEYVFHSGVLSEAMRSSMAIPAAFTPVRKGDMVLVDGGLRNNYPADIARQMGADYIIGSSVQDVGTTSKGMVMGKGVISQIIDINCKNKYEENLEITDIPIVVDTKGYSAASFSEAAIDTLIRRGERAAMQHWDELMQLKKKLGLPDDFAPSHPPLNPEATLPMEVTTEEEDIRPQYDLWQGSIGLRFDSEERVAAQLNGMYSAAHVPVDVDLLLRLGQHIKATAALTWKPAHFARVGLSYTYDYNDLDIYEEGNRDVSFTLHHHRVRLGLADIHLKNLAFDINVAWDHFRAKHLLVSQLSETDKELWGTEYFISYRTKFRYDSEDQPIFPTRGAKFSVEYAYFTDDFTHYKDNNGFSELKGMWRMSIPMGNRLTLQPMIYGRMLFGSDIPYVQYNYIGGYWFGHYLDQQMPFEGVVNMEMSERHFLAGNLNAQLRMLKNHYWLWGVSVGFHSSHTSKLLQGKPLIGSEVGYYYKTMFGPLGASMGYSNLTDKLSFYVNLGFDF